MPQVLRVAHSDPGSQSRSCSSRGRKAVYASENILRALIVQRREGFIFRETVVRIAESGSFQDFLLLGAAPENNPVQYTFIREWRLEVAKKFGPEERGSRAGRRAG